MEEFTVVVECPFCDEESHQCAGFNFNEADRDGCNSGLMKAQCTNHDCDEEFYFTAYVSFEPSVSSVYKEKPSKDKL